MPIPSGGGDAARAVRLLALREDVDGVIAAWVGRDGAVDDIQLGRTRAYSMGDEAGRQRDATLLLQSDREVFESGSGRDEDGDSGESDELESLCICQRRSGQQG
jgi:hypothetical protein